LNSGGYTLSPLVRLIWPEDLGMKQVTNEITISGWGE